MATPSPVTHVSDTARWVAVYRAMESERPDALFDDPFARELAGPEGERIVAGMRKGRKAAWPMIVRTAVMDELIVQAINRDGVDTVLNLAAGLDTRAFRLPLPSGLRWTDADLPGIIDYRTAHLHRATPRCRYEASPVDLADTGARQALFRRTMAPATRALVLTEGLLVYLTPDTVAGLARDLHAIEQVHFWVLDLASPRLLRMLERTWGAQLRDGNAPLQFGPADGTAFFSPLGWREAEFRPMFEESIRLGRTMRGGRFWHWLGRFQPERKREEFRRMSGVVLLERVRA